MTKAVYIHIPFCKKICSYCDFCKMYYHQEYVSNYLKALETEIDKRYQGENVDTIYIGGGTPSVLSVLQLKELFRKIKKIKKSKNIEFSFEMNFDSIDEEKLILLKENGVNRLSFGVETLSPKGQRLLNRVNKKERIKKIISKAKELGFNNINIDLIYAFPGETKEDLKKDLDFIISLDIEHISTYSLIIEEHTILYIEGVENISEDLDAEMYEYIYKRLAKEGYIHYEISNFAKNGKESRHNLCYWNNEHYYGFGLSSASYIDNTRMLNTRSINKYLKGDYLVEKEELTKEEIKEYELILGLRKKTGISKEYFIKKYVNIKDLLENGFLEEDNNRIFIPENKMYLSNEIIVKILKEDV